MLVDGVYVYIRGKYIGPEKPGPWAILFYKFNIDVFKMGWLFIVYGFFWLFWICAFLANKEWAFTLGIIVSILTLWYLPIGSFISILILLILIIARRKIGI